MKFAATDRTLQARPEINTLASPWSPDDRIGLGPAAEADPADWPAWTDEPIELGPNADPVAPAEPQTTRRGFISSAAKLGITAVAVATVATTAATAAVETFPVADPDSDWIDWTSQPEPTPAEIAELAKQDRADRRQDYETAVAEAKAFRRMKRKVRQAESEYQATLKALGV